MGKLLGGLFGLMIGSAIGLGLVGLIVGIWIGHGFDQALGRFFKSGFAFHSGSQSAHSQTVFFEITFSVMGYLAKSDGSVSRNEIRAAEQIMQQCRFDAPMRQRAISAFSLGKAPDFDIDRALNLLYQTVNGHPPLLKLFYDFQVQAAGADGVVGANKTRILTQISAKLGLQASDYFYQHFSGFQQQYHHSRQSHTSNQQRPSIDSAYQTLGVSRSASQSEVKKAYRKLLGENHPDRLMAKGLPEEMIKMANQKVQKIKAAYQQICQQQGWK
jgi:DnaJ like chaperone protein